MPHPHLGRAIATPYHKPIQELMLVKGIIISQTPVVASKRYSTKTLA